MNTAPITREVLREELERFATKEDLKKYATKEDLERFATKEDLADVRVELIDKMAGVDRKVDTVLSKMDFLVEKAGGDRMDALELETALESAS